MKRSQLSKGEQLIIKEPQNGILARNYNSENDCPQGGP